MKTLKIIRTICREVISIVGPKIWLMVLFFTLRNVLALYHPYGFKIIFELIEKKSSVGELLFWCGVSIVVRTASNISDIIGEYIKDKLMKQGRGSKMIAYLKNISSKDYAILISKSTGELITKINNCVDAEFEIVGMMFRKIPSFIIRTTIIIVVLYRNAPLVLCVLPLLFLIPWAIDRITQKKSAQLTEDLNDLSEKGGKQVLKIVQEQSSMRFANQTATELTILDEINQRITNKEPVRNFLESIKSNVIGILFAIMEFGLYGYLGILVVQGDYSMANLVMIGSYVRRFWYPLEIILDNIKSINKNVHKVASFHEFLNIPNVIQDGREKYIHKAGNIELRNVDFSYGSKQIFQNISLIFQGGKTTALVGPSGGGKSTLLKLIMRLWDCSKGAITIDNQNIKNLKISTWYDHVSYLTQEPAIFDGTIRENVDYGIQVQSKALGSKGEKAKSNYKDNDNLIWHSLAQAQLKDMVAGLPDGLDTRIGDRGVKLSGGERQRLGLARVFLKNPQVIILDEPTSALDSQSEHQITTIMKQLFEGKTVIVIAHRLQTVMHADKIYVLGKAKKLKSEKAKNSDCSVVLQEGTHKKLIAQDGVYKQLLDLQKGIVNE